MKVLILISSLTMFALNALSASVDSLDECPYHDTEVSTNMPFQIDFEIMSRLEFTVSLIASPTNVVEVSIGNDANADGNLSLDESEHTFGYNCGKWFHRDFDYDTEESKSAEETVDDLRIENTFILKKERLSADLNLIKIVRRGTAGIDESVVVAGKKSGVLIMVK